LHQSLQHIVEMTDDVEEKLGGILLIRRVEE